MNIENEFDAAEVYLEMAHEKVDIKDYTSALSSLAKSYGHVRSLIENVYKLDREAVAAANLSGKNTE